MIWNELDLLLQEYGSSLYRVEWRRNIDNLRVTHSDSNLWYSLDDFANCVGSSFWFREVSGFTYQDIMIYIVFILTIHYTLECIYKLYTKLTPDQFRIFFHQFLPFCIYVNVFVFAYWYLLPEGQLLRRNFQIFLLYLTFSVQKQNVMP